MYKKILLLSLACTPFAAQASAPGNKKGKVSSPANKASSPSSATPTASAITQETGNAAAKYKALQAKKGNTDYAASLAALTNSFSAYCGKLPKKQYAKEQAQALELLTAMKDELAPLEKRLKKTANAKAKFQES